MNNWEYLHLKEVEMAKSPVVVCCARVKFPWVIKNSSLKGSLIQLRRKQRKLVQVVSVQYRTQKQPRRVKQIQSFKTEHLEEAEMPWQAVNQCPWATKKLSKELLWSAKEVSPPAPTLKSTKSMPCQPLTYSAKTPKLSKSQPEQQNH